MFQGFGSTPSLWNNNKSKFLNRLKKNGKIYTYQNKLYNLGHYTKKVIKGEDSPKLYPNDINFDLSYLDMKNHLQIIFNDIKHLHKYEWVPIGFSFGAFFALAFSKIYKKYCSFCILLDPAHITNKNIKKHMQITKKEIGNVKITNNKLKKLLLNIKNNQYNDHDLNYLSDIGAYYWMAWIKNNITNHKLSIPTYSFMDINYNDCQDVLHEVSVLKNDKNYNYRLFVDSGHVIFKDIAEAKIIINTINNFFI